MPIEVAEAPVHYGIIYDEAEVRTYQKDAVDALLIADTVWDTQVPGAFAAGSAGAEVGALQERANDALVAQNLDHLIKVAKDTDWATTVTKESLLDLITPKSTDQTYSRLSDTLEAIRDRGDLAWLTGASSAANLAYVPASVTKV